MLPNPDMRVGTGQFEGLSEKRLGKSSLSRYAMASAI